MRSPLWRAASAPLSNAERAAMVMSAVRDAAGKAWKPDGATTALVAHVGDGPLRLVAGGVEVPADAFASRNLLPDEIPLHLALAPDRRALMRRKRVLLERTAAQSADDVARRFGPTAHDLGLAGDWKTLRTPGWEEVGDVSVPCPFDGRPLKWWTWSHPRAVKSLHRHVATCSGCDGVGRLPRLLDAAARLHAELANPGTRQYSVYVLEVRHPVRPGWYVGQTWHPPAERVEKHRGGRPREAAKVFQNGGSVGPAQPDALPPLPELSTRQQALAAEQFVHRWLQLRTGKAVYGDGG